MQMSLVGELTTGFGIPLPGTCVVPAVSATDRFRVPLQQVPTVHVTRYCLRPFRNKILIKTGIYDPIALRTLVRWPLFHLNEFEYSSRVSLHVHNVVLHSKNAHFI